MRMLNITRLRQRLSYDPDTGKFVWKQGGINYRRGEEAGCVTTNGYVQIGVDGGSWPAHHLAFILMGLPVPGYVDHRDCDKTNNRWGNLRPCTSSQNLCNKGKSKHNKSGVKGIHWHKSKKRWIARVREGGEVKHHSTHTTLFDAAAAVISARNKFHGEFARH